MAQERLSPALIWEFFLALTILNTQQVDHTRVIQLMVITSPKAMRQSRGLLPSPSDISGVYTNPGGQTIA